MPLGWVQCLKPSISPVLKFGRDDKWVQKLEADRSTSVDLFCLRPSDVALFIELVWDMSCYEDDKPDGQHLSWVDCYHLLFQHP